MAKGVGAAQGVGKGNNTGVDRMSPSRSHGVVDRATSSSARRANWSRTWATYAVARFRRPR